MLIRLAALPVALLWLAALALPYQRYYKLKSWCGGGAILGLLVMSLLN
jgi:hypothetical protein